MVLLVEDARAQWAELDRRIAAFDAELVRWAKEKRRDRRLTTMPGFGPIYRVRTRTAEVERKAETRVTISPHSGLRSRQFVTGGEPGAARNAQAWRRVSAQTIDTRRAPACPISRSVTRRSADGRKS